MERDMKKLLGKPVYDGVAIGKIVVLNKKEMTLPFLRYWYGA